jgi:mannose-6-phosphate isomerase-like protein (cupin superfamily)
VDTVEEAVEAVAAVSRLDRSVCRSHVEDCFSASRMVDRYVRIYEEILTLSQRESRPPWGFYRVLEDSPGYKVKLIQVHPGKRLSLQRHRRRSEHWTVIEGRGLVTRGGEFRSVLPGSSLDIDFGVIHRIENQGQCPLVFIEVQRGDYLGEDDIERFEDDFGRADDPPPPASRKPALRGAAT